MPCAGCGGRRKKSVVSRNVSPAAMGGSRPTQAELERVQGKDENFVMCVWNNPKGGDRGLMGQAAFSERLYPNMRFVRGHWYFDYGYKSPGELVLAHVNDVRLMPQEFLPVNTVGPPSAPPVQAQELSAPQLIQDDVEPDYTPSPDVETSVDESGAVEQVKEAAQEVPEGSTIVVDELPAPEEIGQGARWVTREDEEIDLQTLPGIGLENAYQLGQLGVKTRRDLLELGVDGLQQIQGIGPGRARMIIDAVQSVR